MRCDHLFSENAIFSGPGGSLVPSRVRDGLKEGPWWCWGSCANTAPQSSPRAAPGQLRALMCLSLAWVCSVCPGSGGLPQVFSVCPDVPWLWGFIPGVPQLWGFTPGVLSVPRCAQVCPDVLWLWGFISSVPRCALALGIYPKGAQMCPSSGDLPQTCPGSGGFTSGVPKCALALGI